ncbi:hypothetical protein ABKV19_004469 [Rosa sericea]
MTEAACCTNVMNSRIRALVKAIHSTPMQFVLYLSGGASQAVAWLLSVPGAASTVLETVLPYSQMSIIQLLGKIPDKFCSQHTAEEMALLAYNRALKLSSPDFICQQGHLTEFQYQH